MIIFLCFSLIFFFLFVIIYCVLMCFIEIMNVNQTLYCIELILVLIMIAIQMHQKKNNRPINHFGDQIRVQQSNECEQPYSQIYQ